MSGRIPKPLQAALAAMVASMGAGGGVYLAEQERTSQLQTEYLQTVAADTSTSDAVKLAMVLGSYYESSFRHIGTPYVDRLGKGQPLTVCNGITGAGVVAGRYYTPADCKRLELPKYLAAEKAAKRLFTRWGSYNIWVRASIIDMIYNLGEATVAASTLRAQANAGADFEVWCPQMQRFVYGTVGGKKTRLPGLVARREATAELCRDWGRDGHFSQQHLAKE